MAQANIQPVAGARRLPHVVTPTGAHRLLDALPALHAVVADHLYEVGGVLFRGFEVGGVDEFQAFAASFGHPLLRYEFGSTPRTQVSSGVYTSTEFPPHQSIPLHNEQSYTREWPMKIWFYSALVAAEGGETPIADSREVHARVPASIRERLIARGIVYVRNFGNGLDVPWSRVFNTEDRAEVERYCRDHDIAWEWKDDGELRTRQRAQVVAAHPVTGERVWFNQAHLFHVSNLDAETREALLDAVDVEDLPRDVVYGDGSPIEASLLDEIRGVMGEVRVVFPWQAGDVLMLDNMLAAHAREPFRGPRKVVVAMAEPHRA